MVDRYRHCPQCGTPIEQYKNPIPTVDVIIEYKNDEGKEGIIMIFRGNDPHQWALPGGFVEYAESLEQAAAREAEEETSLKVTDLRQFHTYSNPDRDPRHHTITTVYIGKGNGVPRANDDAKHIGIFTHDSLPDEIAFDHREVLVDYFNWKKKKELED